MKEFTQAQSKIIQTEKKDLVIIYEYNHQIMPSQHTDFKVVKFLESGKGDVVCERLNHQKQHRAMLMSEEGSPNSATITNKIKLKYQGLRFLSDGTLLSVAYYIRQNLPKSSRNGKDGKIHMATKLIQDDEIKFDEQPLRMQIVNIECENDQDFNKYTTAKACIVGENLCLKLGSEKFIRVIDLKGRYKANGMMTKDPK